MPARSVICEPREPPMKSSDSEETRDTEESGAPAGLHQAGPCRNRKDQEAQHPAQDPRQRRPLRNLADLEAAILSGGNSGVDQPVSANGFRRGSGSLAKGGAG